MTTTQTELPGILDALDSYVASDVMSAIHRHARKGVEFTADDLDLLGSTRAALKGRTGTLGACFRHAARSGLIEAVGYAAARHELANGRPQRIWRGK